MPHERDALLRQAAEVLRHERGVVVDLRVPPAETAAKALLSAHRRPPPPRAGGRVGAHSSTMMDRMWGGAANTGATRHAAATRRRIIIAPVCADCEGQATAADRPRTASWQSRIVARQQAVGAAAARLLARTPTPKLPTPNANGMRILVVQAHPHDFTFCGGTCGIHVARGDPTPSSRRPSVSFTRALSLWFSPRSAPPRGSGAQATA